MFFSSVQTFQYPGTCSGPGPPPAAMLTATVHCCFDFPSPCKLSTSVFCTILLRCWGHVTLQCYFVYSYLGLMEIYHKRPSLLQGKEALTRHLSVPSPLPSNLIRSLLCIGKLPNSYKQIQISQKSNLCLKVQTLLLAVNIVKYFP